ncbi:MAG: DUF6734 family protein [Bacteroidota bacterium]
MKIVHSLWTKPFKKALHEKQPNYGGWPSKSFLYMSWALSCLQFRKFYDNVELVTDAAGYELLIEKLKLPYTNVQVVLDAINHYPEKLWAAGKLYAYQLQDTPFVHADGDVFIWEKFTPTLENSSLLAQHFDATNGHYKHSLEEAEKFGFHIPEVIQEYVKDDSNFSGHSAGIIGGSDLEFFQKFCHASFKVMDENIDKYHVDFKATSYALLYEQFLFSALARQDQKQVTCLIDDNLLSELHINISDFNNKYRERFKYAHMAGFQKKRPQYGYELRNQLQVDYPEHLELIQRIIHD